MYDNKPDCLGLDNQLQGRGSSLSKTSSLPVNKRFFHIQDTPGTFMFSYLKSIASHLIKAIFHFNVTGTTLLGSFNSVSSVRSAETSTKRALELNFSLQSSPSPVSRTC